MKFRWPWQKKKEAELDSFAEELESLFQPVQPREEFVRGLRDNLLDRPKPAWLGFLPKAGWQLILVIGGGVISAVLMIFGGVRFVTNLVSRKKTKKADVIAEPEAEISLEQEAKPNKPTEPAT